VADIFVDQIAGTKFTAAVGSSVTLGMLVCHDGTRFEEADADSHSTPAQYLVVGVDQYGGDDKRATLARQGVIRDADSPYTLGDVQYTSGTAGAITSTFPTGNGDLRQVVGRAISTSEVEIDISQPKVRDDFIVVSTYDTTGEPGLGITSTGWTGPGVDSNGEKTYIGAHSLPYNFLSLLEARVITNNEAGTAAVDYDFTIVGAYDGQSNAQDTGTAITAADVANTPPAANIIEYFDVSSAFDSGFVGPGRTWELFLDPDGVGSAELQILGARLVYLVTD